MTIDDIESALDGDDQVTVDGGVYILQDGDVVAEVTDGQEEDQD